MKNLSVILFALSSFFFSCKKDNNDIIKTTSSKVQGKWKIDSIVVNQYFNGTYNKSTNMGTPEDYVEFRSDGRMLTSFQGHTDNSSYAIASDKIIVFGGDSADIVELTDTKFIIYTKADAGVIGYIETSYYLKR
jgi:hypothetical protein